MLVDKLVIELIYADEPANDGSGASTIKKVKTRGVVSSTSSVLKVADDIRIKPSQANTFEETITYDERFNMSEIAKNFENGVLIQGSTSAYDQNNLTIPFGNLSLFKFGVE